MSDKKGYHMENGVIHGGVVDLPPDINYAKVYLNILSQYEEKICLIDGTTEQKISFKELITKTLKVAASLKSVGVKKGDVLAICSENRIEFMVTVFAVIYIGGIANFINCSYIKDELLHTLEISKPTCMFFSPSTYNAYYETVSKLSFINKHFIFGNATGTAIGFNNLLLTNSDFNFLQPAKTAGSDTAILLYSSGTTGLPKGVKWTHQCLAVTIFQPICSSSISVILGIAPWSNTIGFMLTKQNMCHGMTVVFLAKFNEETYLRTIEKYKVNLLIAVPPLVILLSKSQILNNYNLKSIKLIQCGGSVLKLNTISEVKKRLPSLEGILNAYGMTEATGVVTMETDCQSKQGTVGKVALGIVAKVVDVESQKILGPNNPGELYIKGLALFGGYLGRVKGDDFDANGFYKTGDIVYYDEERYFYIVDRIKELIKYKAYQVPPSELEAVILQHPGVKDAGVVGMPNSFAGELPYAFVVKRAGANVAENDIIDYVAEKVSPWKRLRGGVKFISEIPKNGSGKILRRELRKMLPTMSKI